MAKLNIHEGDQEYILEAAEGSNLLSFLNRNGFNISNPCGGNGTCGKCKVKVLGHKKDISEKEAELLGDKLLDENIRLACYVNIECDMDIYLLDTSKKAVIMTEAEAGEVILNPRLKKELITLESVDPEKPETDFIRFKKHVAAEKLINIDLTMLEKISDFTAEEQELTLVYNENTLLDIEKGNTKAMLYGISVDIGTTTLAAYLVNLNTGDTIDIYSCLNSQKKFGDDVISRINYTIQNEDGIKILKDSIINDINKAVQSLTSNNGLTNDKIYNLVITGNTTMLHMVMGLNARKISISPFIPVTTELHEFSARPLNININPNGVVTLLPCVSAYIGADTLCAMLASNMHQDEKIKLMVDIGTNGEIALGSKDIMYTCSVAAGPAFEGSQLKNGVGGIEGAIDKVILTKGFQYTTIGDAEPVGICGSGIVDAIAELLEKGIIDNTGRFLEDDELPKNLEDEIKSRINELNGMKAFLLYKAKNEADNIYVTQKDIREIQNAKAAISAGIKTLIKLSDLSYEDISKVYLAGGFGSYINIESALKIGLLPKELSGKVSSIGNAAGAGAVQVLKSSERFMELLEIKNKTEYIELSGNNEFTDLYITSMMLE